MKGGKERDRPRYDDADEIGEDPFRWLCVFESSPGMVKKRIDSIERDDRLAAWFDCETVVGPRQPVIAALNQRKAELERRDDQAARADQFTRQAAADGGQR